MTPWVYASFINMEEVGIRKVVEGELDGWEDWQLGLEPFPSRSLVRIRPE